MKVKTYIGVRVSDIPENLIDPGPHFLDDSDVVEEIKNALEYFNPGASKTVDIELMDDGEEDAVEFAMPFDSTWGLVDVDRLHEVIENRVKAALERASEAVERREDEIREKNRKLVDSFELRDLSGIEPEGELEKALFDAMSIASDLTAKILETGDEDSKHLFVEQMADHYAIWDAMVEGGWKRAHEAIVRRGVPFPLHYVNFTCALIEAGLIEDDLDVSGLDGWDRTVEWDD